MKFDVYYFLMLVYGVCYLTTLYILITEGFNSFYLGVIIGLQAFVTLYFFDYIYNDIKNMDR